MDGTFGAIYDKKIGLCGQLLIKINCVTLGLLKMIPRSVAVRQNLRLGLIKNDFKACQNRKLI